MNEDAIMNIDFNISKYAIERAFPSSWLQAMPTALRRHDDMLMS